jgi:hypothetical protein
MCIDSNWGLCFLALYRWHKLKCACKAKCRQVWLHLNESAFPWLFGYIDSMYPSVPHDHSQDKSGRSDTCY